MRVLVYDRNDSPLFEITPDELYGLVRDEQLDGPRSLTITTTHVLQKNQRVLVRDATERWHEYVVEGCDEEHGKGNRPIGTYWCSWSMQHDLELTVVSKMPSGGVSTALAAVLSGTKRWTAGTVTKVKTASASMYEMGGWEAVAVMCDAWECEVDDEITVDTAGVVSRSMAALEHVGSSTATRRFDYGADMKSIKRSVDEEPVFARIIPKGMGEETDTGYYGRRIGIESVNGGVPWLENATTAPYLRVPDGEGGYEYPTRYVVNDELDDPAELKAWALANLDEWTAPKVTYGADLCQFQQAGLDANGVALGDEVQVVDRAFGEDGLRIAARVVSLRINELDPADMALVIGDAPANMATGLTSLAGTLSDVKSTVEVMNGGSMTTADYLSRLVDRLNYAINATGGYSYLVPGLGMVTYDVPVADPADPVEASAVVEIRGGTVRIADSKNQDGTWQYKTVFTSGHLAADVVTAANITAGYIGSSGSTFIDLDNDVIQLGDQSGVWTSVSSDSFDISIGNNVGSIAHYGYGTVAKYPSGTANGVYYTLGSRASGSQNGILSIAEGYSNIASGEESHAEGCETTASGHYSHAEGSYTTASGESSHAEGNSTTASGAASHAEGSLCTASGDYSRACGFNTTASGERSSAEGTGSTASGNYSHAQNIGTIAASEGQTAIGSYNVSDGSGNYAFIIGNGNSPDARSNALTVDWDGNVVAAGKVSVKDPTINRDGTLPSSDVWASSYLNLQDKDGEVIGCVRNVQRTSGRIDTFLYAYNEDSGTGYDNYIRLSVARDGTCSYYVKDAAAFRSALALNTWTTVAIGDFATAASGWEFSTNNCNIQYNEALGALRCRIQVYPTAAQTAGQKTVFTVKTAYRPKTFAASLSSLTSNAQAIQLYTTGGGAVNIVAINANTNLYFNGVYFIGA